MIKCLLKYVVKLSPRQISCLSPDPYNLSYFFLLILRSSLHPVTLTGWVIDDTARCMYNLHTVSRLIIVHSDLFCFLRKVSSEMKIDSLGNEEEYTASQDFL